MNRAEIEQLVGIASEILTEAEQTFRDGLGASEEIVKGPGDYATAVDLELERRISAALAERTGVSVHGEEYGGPDPHDGTVWVLDPIDGTANFSQRVPLTGINLALLDGGVTRAGLTWLPFLDERYIAVEDGPVRRNGEALPALKPTDLARSVVTIGHIGDGELFPLAWRLRLLDVLSRRSLRVRVLGSTALEQAWVAAGALSVAISFGNKPWDTAPGVCLVRAAGGVVADLGGAPHTLDSRSALTGAPGAAEEVLEILAQL